MYYLIEHNRETKETSCFEHDNYDEARQDCLRKEQKFARDGKHEVEVVIFEADSLEDLKKTHSRYFIDDNDNKNKSNKLMTISAIGLVTLAVMSIKGK